MPYGPPALTATAASPIRDGAPYGVRPQEARRTSGCPRTLPGYGLLRRAAELFELFPDLGLAGIEAQHLGEGAVGGRAIP
jgi:hypothetical protein